MNNTEPVAVMMTRDEAETYMLALNKAREGCVAVIMKISRKRRPLRELADMAKPYQDQLNTLVKLQEKIGTVFNLGGY